jgi:hypothetical protein
MVAGELSPSALIWLFGDRAVEDDREANGRFLPPSTRWKGDRVARMMEVARGQVTSARDVERLEELEAGLEKVRARVDKGEWQLPTLLMSVAAWNLREPGDPSGSSGRRRRSTPGRSG